MSWNLFIDDIRDTSYVDRVVGQKKWEIARTVDDAMALFKKHGCFPSFISFDHDLGPDEQDAIVLVHNMIDMDMSQSIEFPNDFAYNVHSANPVGAENIRGLIDGYLKFKKDHM